MKIGLVCPYNMFKGGGVQEHVQALHSELTRRGHDVRIITPLPRDFEGNVPSHIITIGISANVRAFFSTQTQLSATVDTEAIERILNKEKFELIHFHEPWVPVLSRQVLTRSKAINIATSHARIPDRFSSKTFINVVTPYTRGHLKYIHAFSAVSEPAAEYIKTFTKEPIHIIPNGINLNKYRSTNGAFKHHSKKTILYVGRLEKRKGVRALLYAFNLLASKNHEVQLMIAGTGPEEYKLREIVENFKIPRVTFLGYISDEDKIRHLHQASLFCSPASYGESFGIVLLEAMAADLPIVAGDNPGYEAVLKERGRISLVNPKDTSDFARRLEIMVYDEAQRNLWIDWARVYVEQFDYKYIVNAYEKLYVETVARYAQ